MSIDAAAAAAPIQVDGQANAQNLFEHAAAHAKGLPESASPGQLGSEVMQGLQGYAERSTSLAERAGRLTGGVPEAPGSSLVSLSSDPGAMPAPPQKAPVDGSQMDRAIESLGMMFDHAIETQLVVRGATQVAGAANTLLRGQ
ncbi:hypothetical protein [Falsirhodobacter sp. 20TX0035]|uniref:hypothetical protein n=1 Tax=Falsirhodobacter sp. 20TX0035 TaxID=3022019 RepID=UPI00232FC1C9|nr:hypothetical protein [Falsirhodobacter sp. 20TX0035]MDB6454405.1 hypothetical protein [Falsirhodobacter sp. 20TX0035]